MQIVSLDIQNSLNPLIDISREFSLSPVQAIYNGVLKPVIDEIFPQLPDIVLQKEQKVKIDDFITFPTLDLIHPDLIVSSFWQKKYPYLQKSYRKITICDPLYIPFQALDIREGFPLPKTKTYPDLFVRHLSSGLRIKKFSRISWDFLKKRKNFLWKVALFFLILTFPTLWYVKFSIESAYKKILSLAYIQNSLELKQTLHSVKSDFDRARFLFFPFSWIPGEMMDIADRAIVGGHKIFSHLDDVLDSMEGNDEKISLRVLENKEESLYRGSSKDIFLGEAFGIPFPTTWIKENNEKITTLLESFSESEKIFSQVEGSSQYAEKMRNLAKILKNLQPLFQGYIENSHNILTMLGDLEPQRYIIFNQNRDEIRANGGFPGSIISFTMYKGNILDYRTDDVYYYDWNLYPHKESPPPGISLLTDTYGLRDVNYYPDFEKTLQKANAFVERAGDSTLTTAIAIHQGLIEEILEVIGPVRVEGIEEEFTSKNFSLLMSILVENKFAKDKTPKDILFQFISAFGKQVIASKKFDEIARVIGSHWDRGEILIASRNEDIQGFLKSIQRPLPWETTEKNWIYPIFTSVSGNKSDRYLYRSIEMSTLKGENCNYNTTATLIFEHQYSQQDSEQIEIYMKKYGLKDKKEQEKMRFIQGNGRNKTFVRLFVPKNSELSGTGIDVSEDENAKIFSFVMETPVGGKASKTIQYSQKIENCNEYSGEIPVYRQPGLRQLLTP